MKNKIILTLALTAASVSYAQVGVNTTTPKSTFDITAKNPTGIARNADGLLIPRVDRARAQLMQNVETSTMIYVNNLNGNAIGTTKNIDVVGFYYFDGIYWVKMVVDPSAFKDNDNNIYNTDGTLAANRTVTQNDKKLNFITTSENGFSVTSATAPVLTVSGNTNRVGIGYATPIGTLAVSNSSAQADNVIVAGYNKDTGDARNVVLYNSRTTNANFGGIEFVPGDKGNGLSGASIRGIDRDFSNGYGVYSSIPEILKTSRLE
ncbi:hypothetical protein [Chryseobacterium sp. MMS23-Vi53]|uniref:hypothetical protein n=1 Tax=Chryseobacterium sp. MMS23-Vi53 TaxID=3386644 RepID=UPI0039E7BD3C